jgi:ATP phosphoribosyltransferase
MTRVRVAVPRKGRPLEAVLQRLARYGWQERADDLISTLRYEKSIAKGTGTVDASVYDRLAEYSDVSEPTEPEYTVVRDDRDGLPRRIVFDSVVVSLSEFDLELVGREEPLRSLRKHEFALGFDSADLVLAEVVTLRDEPLTGLDEVNERIDPVDTDVRIVTGLGDTVYHTLLADPTVCESDTLDRTFVTEYEGPLCISPRYERLVEAVLGSAALDGVTFTYPESGREEEASIAETGLGVYLTVTGATARDYGLVVGSELFPSETVLLSNAAETAGDAERAIGLLADDSATELPTV